MSNDWIFEVLTDLKDFALANGLPALADKADEAMRTAEAEIAAQLAVRRRGQSRPH